jgi:hypothetical protein
MVLLILTELFLPPAPAAATAATAVAAASLFCCPPTPAVRRVVGNPLALLASLLLTTLNNKTNIKSIKKGVNINIKTLSFERVKNTHTFSTENDV